MAEPNSLFATKDPSLVAREGLQLIARVDLGLGAAALCLFGLTVLILFAEELLLKDGDVFHGDGDGGWLSAEHFEGCLKDGDGFG